jgi:predicted short-subunit dehydrogenase-like oxidoreductase (DUF2520 family)
MHFSDDPPLPLARPQRLLVMGAGPVGHFFAQSLVAAGFSLRHWSRSRGPLFEESGPRQAVDIAILAVRDQAIAQAAQFLVDHGAADGNTVLLHCAGALPPLEVFAAQLGRVRGAGLLHPLRSFVDGGDLAGESMAGGSSQLLTGTVIAIGGDDAGLAAAQLLCEAVGGQPLAVSAEQQGAYHAAAVMAAGHVTALLEVATHVLTRIGLHRPLAERALAALTRSVTNNIDRVGMTSALSGPFARGDAGTVGRHLAALRELSAESEAVYRALAPSALDLAYRKGSADPDGLDQIARLIFGDSAALTTAAAPTAADREP